MRIAPALLSIACVLLPAVSFADQSVNLDIPLPASFRSVTPRTATGALQIVREWVARGPSVSVVNIGEEPVAPGTKAASLVSIERQANGQSAPAVSYRKNCGRDAAITMSDFVRHGRQRKLAQSFQVIGGTAYVITYLYGAQSSNPALLNELMGYCLTP